MTNTDVVAAQGQLVTAIKDAVTTFLNENEGVSLESLHYEVYPVEEGKNVRCSVSYTDEQGARVTRSI